MKKNKAVIILVIMLAVILGLGYYATSIVTDTMNTPGQGDSIKLGLDLAGGVSIKYQASGKTDPTSEEMSDTVYKLQKRVEQYSTEAQVYQEGTDRINIEIPGVTDANEILEALGKPGSLYFIAQTGSDGKDNYTISGNAYQLTKSLDELEADGSIVCQGTNVTAATPASITQDGQRQYVVDITFDADGTKAFGDATTKAYNNGETIGIYYDDQFVSVPRVDEPITGGNCQISGQETYDEAKELASTIRIGGLKVQLSELSSSVVGAQMGSQAIKTSMLAAGIGILLIIIFMCAIYWIPGLASSLALIIYTELVVIILKAFSITLTLPGIAGIILSIGMAVDANVIVFARIREEIATGKTVNSSIAQGYSRALSAIIDGNVTTLIAAAILGIRGTGTVKGFAVTLALGIIVSMFTALFVTKLIMNCLFGLGIEDEKFYGKAKELKPINIVKYRWIYFAISIILVLSGPVAMAVNSSTIGHPLNFSLEFLGGTSSTVTFDKDYSIEEIDRQIVPLVEKVTGDSAVTTSKVSGTNQVVIKTKTLDLDKRAEFAKVMADNFGVTEDKIQTETITSTISSEMSRDAVVATIIALILMLAYIWFRFKDIRFGAAAVLALLHDALIVVACYAITKISVGGTFIACVLTIIGYSINATIVIFDRFRENTKLMSHATNEELINKSVTQTLSRSVFTSLTTFITVFILYLMGVSSIKDFALPIMVGVVVGTYSSVFISGNLWYEFKKIGAKKIAAAPVKAAANNAASSNGTANASGNASGNGKNNGRKKKK